MDACFSASAASATLGSCGNKEEGEISCDALSTLSSEFLQHSPFCFHTITLSFTDDVPD